MASKLASMEIYDLFGQFDHVIPLKHSEHITAILGPNGYGKTVCLKLIEALFKKRFTYFNNVDYSSIKFTFTGGEVIVVTKIAEEAIATDKESDPTKLPINLTFKDANGVSSTWAARAGAILPARIAALQPKLPFLSRVGPMEWTEDRTGERLSIDMVIERYSQFIPPEFFDPKQKTEAPDSFHALIGATDCHLIETQRLMVMTTDDPRFLPAYDQRRRIQAQQWVVYQKAQTLRDIFQTELTRYATLSQSLDRTFPKRAIEHRSESVADNELLKSELRSLDEKRQALMNTGILDKAYEPISLDHQYIERSVADVLQIYVDDTKEKLRVFDGLLEKLELFQGLILDRFSPKTMSINRNDGFLVLNSRGKSIPLEKLSSGEQHQLILLFDLLFEVTDKSLILIDEPELSLHISWQKKFISDLKKIIALNKFDVVLATHSSALISRFYDLAVELGDVDNG